MKKTLEMTTCIAPQSQSSIEEAVEEALLVAEFFDLVSRDANELQLHLSPGSPLADYLEIAQKYIDTPISMDELSALTVLLRKRG